MSSEPTLPRIEYSSGKDQIFVNFVVSAFFTVAMLAAAWAGFQAPPMTSAFFLLVIVGTAGFAVALRAMYLTVYKFLAPDSLVLDARGFTLERADKIIFVPWADIKAINKMLVNELLVPQISVELNQSPFVSRNRSKRDTIGIPAERHGPKRLLLGNTWEDTSWKNTSEMRDTMERYRQAAISSASAPN